MNRHTLNKKFAIPGMYRNIGIIYEDNHLLVVNKPANMLSQADESGGDDLQSILKNYIGEKYQKPGNVFLALVQRLDRPASGLMVLARTSKAASRLSAQIRNREMVKRYIAVVEAAEVMTGFLRHHLVKDEEQKKSLVLSGATKHSREAVLEVQHIASAGSLSLIGITLQTGRFHQIRVQLSASGMPIAGDHKYGARTKFDRRLALCCHRLQFQHPTKKEQLSFSTGLPPGEPWDRFRRQTDLSTL